MIVCIAWVIVRGDIIVLKHVSISDRLVCIGMNTFRSMCLQKQKQVVQFSVDRGQQLLYVERNNNTKSLEHEVTLLHHDIHDDW